MLTRNRSKVFHVLACGILLIASSGAAFAQDGPPVDGALVVKLKFQNFYSCIYQLGNLQIALGETGGSMGAPGLADPTEIRPYCRNLFPDASKVSETNPCVELDKACAFAQGNLENCWVPTVSGIPRKHHGVEPNMETIVVDRCRMIVEGAAPNEAPAAAEVSHNKK